MAWYDSNWEYRIKITSDSSLVESSVKGLAIDLSNISESDFWSNVQSDGADIRITESDGETELARDVISIDTSNEKGLIRFDSSGISTSEDTDFFIYFGNSNASEPGASDSNGQYNAYSSDLEAYYPFENDSVEDRTENENDGTNNGATTGVDGQVGESAEFGGGDYISVEDFISGYSEMSFSVWAYLDSDSDDKTIFGNWRSGGPQFLLFSDVGELRFLIRDEDDDTAEANTNTFTDGEWTHISGTYEKNNKIKIYVNGDLEDEVDISTGDIKPKSDDMYIGADNDNSRNWDGKLDEPFIKSSVTSSNEVKTIYNNESDNSSFWSISSVEEDFEVEESNSTIEMDSDEWEDKERESSNIDYSSDAFGLSLDSGETWGYWISYLFNLTDITSAGYSEVSQLSLGNDPDHISKVYICKVSNKDDSLPGRGSSDWKELREGKNLMGELYDKDEDLTDKYFAILVVFYREDTDATVPGLESLRIDFYNNHSITGNVTLDGSGVDGAYVTVLRHESTSVMGGSVYYDDYMDWLVEGSFSTDSNGDYEVDGLKPDEYYTVFILYTDDGDYYKSVVKPYVKVGDPDSL